MGDAGQGAWVAGRQLGRLVGWRLRPPDQSCLMEIFRMPGAEARDTCRGEGDCATMVGRACCKEGGV